MGDRAEYYGTMVDQGDTPRAIVEVIPEILQAQEALRLVSPEHIYLRLVSATPQDEGPIRFHKGFGQHISYYSKKPRSDLGNWFYGLGYYIEMLGEEADKFAQTRKTP